jgi:hypothetical protein
MRDLLEAYKQGNEAERVPRVLIRMSASPKQFAQGNVAERITRTSSVFSPRRSYFDWRDLLDDWRSESEWEKESRLRFIRIAVGLAIGVGLVWLWAQALQLPSTTPLGERAPEPASGAISQPVRPEVVLEVEPLVGELEMRKPAGAPVSGAINWNAIVEVEVFLDGLEAPELNMSGMVKVPTSVAHVVLAGLPTPTLATPPDADPTPSSAISAQVALKLPADLSPDRLYEVQSKLRGTGAALKGTSVSIFNVAESEVRFFHEKDRPEAAQIAEALGTNLRDFSAFRPAPNSGTLELWLALER